jgi:hypothetical protein
VAAYLRPNIPKISKSPKTLKINAKHADYFPIKNQLPAYYSRAEVADTFQTRRFNKPQTPSATT